MKNKFPTVLLLGPSGQVGWELERVLAPLAEVIAVSRKDPIYCGDLTDLNGIARTIQQIQPDIIFNAAAYTAVDKAEDEVELAFRVNADALSVIGKEANKLGALVVHYSTDYVFDGDGDTPFKENDEQRISPVNVYGKSKRQGELNLINETSSYLIFRTSWVYGAHGKNFMKTILRLAKERNQLSVVNDQVGTPTSAAMIADLSVALALRAYYREHELFGIYHLVADGAVSWFEFAKWIVEETEHPEQLKLSPGDITPLLSKEYPTKATRPLNSRMANTKLKCVLPDKTIQNWQYYASRVLSTIS